MNMPSGWSPSIKPPDTTIEPRYTLRQPSTRGNTHMRIMANVPDGKYSKDIQDILNDIVLVLEDPAAQDLYLTYVFDVQKDVAGDPARRAAFHIRLKDFVTQHHIHGLHNRYIQLMRLGSSAIYHMPFVCPEHHDIQGSPSETQ